MHRFTRITNKLEHSELLRHNLIFFLGTMGIAFFNYLYYPVLSRLVSVSDFGEIQAVVSLFMQLGIILTAFGYVITNIVSNARTPKEGDRTILHLEQLMLIAGIAILPILLLAAQLFGKEFKLHSILPVALVGLLIIINIPATSRAYMLQGAKRLKEVSISGIVYAAGKLILSVGFIYLLTNDVTAAVSGYLIAQILTLVYIRVVLKDDYVPLRKSLDLSHVRKLDKKMRGVVKQELIYGLVILVILSGLTLLYTSDTILARLFFDPHTLGLYSGASSVARIVFFVTASVAGVLIASVKMIARSKDNERILLRSLGIVTIIGGAVSAIFMLAPDFSVRFLVGVAYAEAASWLPNLTVVMFLCSLNNLLAIYQIALRRYRAVIPILLGVVVLTCGLALYHSTISQFIAVFLAANLSVFVLLFIEIMLDGKRKAESGEKSSIGYIAEL